MIEDQLDTLAKAKNTIKTNHDVRRRQILQQDQQLKHSLKTHAEDLIVDLDNKYLEQDCCLSKEEERVASKELKLENTKAIIQSILQSHKADSILSISRTVLQDIPGRDNYREIENRYVFVTGNVTKEAMANSYGCVEESVKPNESMDMDLKVVGAYLINHKYMHTFIPCDNEQLLWIYDISQNMLTKMNIHRKKFVNSFHSQQIVDMAMKSEGKLLICVHNSPILTHYSSNDKLVGKNYFYSQLPVSIHVTGNDNIIVGLQGFGSSFPFPTNMNSISRFICSKDEKFHPDETSI
jgi:hypothetical protein